MSYDSTVDTKSHIARVYGYIDAAVAQLQLRARIHDKSKLDGIEKQAYDEAGPRRLAKSTYGSQEYKDNFKQGLMPDAITHHYAHNSHHPEHYKFGIAEMSLLDLLEMLADWKAASERHEDGSFAKSLPLNKERFNICAHLYSIIVATAKELGYVTEQEAKEALV